MTRYEILSMEPGRELDVLVMQIVFKVEKKDIGDECYWVSEANGEEVRWPRWLFSPSTDISAAWGVVEKFEYIDVRRFKDHWGCTVHGQTVTGKTAPEAICKAALLAVMEGEKDDRTTAEIRELLIQADESQAYGNDCPKGGCEW